MYKYSTIMPMRFFYNVTRYNQSLTQDHETIFNFVKQHFLFSEIINERNYAHLQQYRFK